MKLIPLGSAAAFALAASLVGLPALANGRFPAAGQIAVDPSDPSHLVVRTTYGLTVTNDHGAHWSWVCEAAVGYSGAALRSGAATQQFVAFAPALSIGAGLNVAC